MRAKFCCNPGLSYAALGVNVGVGASRSTFARGQDDGKTESSEARKVVLKLRIEAATLILKRHPYNFTRFVVEHPDMLRLIGRSVVGPCNLAVQHVLGTLQPLEADQRGGAQMGLAKVSEFVGQRISFRAARRRLGFLSRCPQH